MKIFYYMGPNQKNKSRVSWKMWKIARRARTVQVWWGAATIVQRNVTKVNELQSKCWTLPTIAAAKADEERRIREKLNGGYSRKARRKTSSST